jgi:phosphoglycolate phosphatase-like HAD superfamily hydrolase
MSDGRIPMESLEAILFDLDGTLVETDNRWAAVLADRLAPLKRLNPRVDTQRLGRWIVMGIETPSNYAIAWVERLGLGHLLAGLADRIRRSKGLATRGESEPVPGTLELLNALMGRYRLAVVTTRARPEATSFLAQLGLERFFPVIITRNDVLRMKPHPEPVLRAAQRLGVRPSKCLMVGDTTMDIRAGRRAGAYTLGVLSGFGERGELERAGAHRVLDCAAQLLEEL